MDEITNKVANSKLLTIDLEDYYPQGERVLFDIKPWLFHELILKEKDFRAFVEAYDWSLLKDQYLALHCSSDAIIPSWAYLLIASKAAAFARKIVVGDLVVLETSLSTKTCSKKWTLQNTREDLSSSKDVPTSPFLQQPTPC